MIFVFYIHAVIELHIDYQIRIANYISNWKCNKYNYVYIKAYYDKAKNNWISLNISFQAFYCINCFAKF